MPYLSIVIPAFNARKTIIPLLASISASRGLSFPTIEVIVVDDHSTDQTVPLVMKYAARHTRLGKSLRLIRLRKNQGPAAARNIGVRYAVGRIVLFLDSDVEVYPETIQEIITSFKNDPDLFALTGVWDKKQRTKSFFPKFKALRDWSYWINERDPKNYYYLFSTRIAAIDRELFLRLGGFDTTYKAALVEDIDLTYRIARRYAVVFNPRARVHHEFEGFVTVAKKYFLRSYYWSKLYRVRKKFDPVATTWKEAMTTISAGIFVIGSLLYLVLLGIRNQESGIMGVVTISSFFPLIHASLFLILLIHLLGVRKFLWFCMREEGVWFALRAFGTGIVLSCVILAGAVFSQFNLLGDGSQRPSVRPSPGRSGIR